MTQLQALKKSYNTLTTIEMLLEDCWPDNIDAQQKIDEAEIAIKQAIDMVHDALHKAELSKYNEIMNSKKQIVKR